MIPVRIVGIDPGFTGAIALLDPGSWTLEIHDMPVLSTTKGKTLLNYTELCNLLAPNDAERSIAILEKVSAMPGQGVSSMFRFGQCLGALQMAIAGHGYEVFEPTASIWKKHFGLSKDKDASRGLAIQRFPGSSGAFTRKKDADRAEAALMALYGLEVLLPKLGTTNGDQRPAA